MKKLSIFLFLVLLSVTMSYAQTSQNPKYSRVRIHLDQVNIQDIVALGLECDHGHLRKDRYIDNDYSEAEIQLLRDNGYSYDILIEDVVEHYQMQNIQSSLEKSSSTCVGNNGISYPTPSNFNLGSMGGYFTYQEMLDNLDSMASKYPNLINTRQIIDPNNLTHEGRPIYWVRISDNPSTDESEPEVLYTALHHAREPMSLSQQIMYMWYLLENYSTDPGIKYLLDNTELYFVPCLNPDGYVYNQVNVPNGGGMWRKNRRNNGGSYGVDLNRNYGYAWAFNNSGSSGNPSSDTYRGPSAFSEPETQNIRDFTVAHNFQLALNYHSYGNMLIYPWAYSDLQTADSLAYVEFSALMTKENNYITGTGTETVGYTSNGDADDWFYGEQTQKNKVLAMTPEAGDSDLGFWPPITEIDRLCKANIWQNYSMAWLVHNFGMASDMTDPILTKLNNQIYFDLKRYGYVSGNLTVSLTPISTNILSAGLAKSYTLNQFENIQDSIFLELNPSIISGEEVVFVLNVDNGNIQMRDTITKIYGAYGMAFLDNGDDLSNWTNIGAASNWEVTNADYYSAPSSITDSKNGEYNNNEVTEIILTQTLDLSNASDANLTFWAKWEIEAAYDYVQVMAVADDGSGTFQFEPLCGLYTTLGTADQDENQPLHDGEQNFWVQECMSLNDFLGESQVTIKIRLVSDQWIDGDGFYFDDFQVNILDAGQVSSLAQVQKLNILGQNQPNPAQEQVFIPLDLSTITDANLELIVTDVLGREVYRSPIDQNSVGVNLTINDWENGFYFYRLAAERIQSQTYKMHIHR
ncbi:MAG: immune inhibitor A [Saprospiraceae bacterium]|nr:immune inhibitor A [Saprospiraceae bacterium]